MSALHSFGCSSDNPYVGILIHDHFFCRLQSMSARPVKCAAGDTHECNAVQIARNDWNHLSGGPESRSSAPARLDGGVPLSFSRLCSFFGSWSRRTFPRLNMIQSVLGTATIFALLQFSQMPSVHPCRPRVYRAYPMWVQQFGLLSERSTNSHQPATYSSCQQRYTTHRSRTPPTDPSCSP
jgi:hypothetical protein